MFIYIALLVGCAAAGLVLCNEKFGKHGKMTYCILAAVVFILVSAFRFEVGYDYLLYGGIFSQMKYWDISDLAVHRMEKGFLFSSTSALKKPPSIQNWYSLLSEALGS